MASNNTIVIDVVPRLLGDKLGGQVLSMASKTSKAIAAPMNAAANAAGLATIAGLAVALTAGASAAIKFEDAFAMVKKTMADVKDPEVFKEIQKDLLGLATTLPVTANELAGIASVAGQLGVAAEDVSVFTEVAAKLGIATNMTSTQAATGLARFLNVTNNTTDTVGKFGSVLVQLGNNVAATESEILLLAQNFGATGNVAGLSAEDILAFSAATRAAGVQAAAGSTALGKLFMNVSNAVKEGDFEKIAVLNKMVGGGFVQAFEEDGAMAVQSFLEGLARLAQSGESVTPVLQALGLNNVRTSRAVLALANNNRGLADAIALARNEALVSNALNAEVATRMDTVSNKVQQLKAAFNALLIPLGDVFLPVFKAILDVAINVVNGFLGLQRVFGELSSAVQRILGVLLGANGLATAFDFLNRLLGGVGKNGKQVGKVMQFLQGVFKKIAPFIKKAFLPITAIIMALNQLGKSERIIRDFEKNVESMANTLSEIDAKGAEFAEVFTEEVFLGIAEGLPEAIQEGVQAGIKAGTLTEEGIEASKQIADGLQTGLVNDLKNIAGVGDLLFKDVDVSQVVEDLEAAGLTENSEILSLVDEINTLSKQQNRQAAEKVGILKDQLQMHLLIIEAERQNLTVEEMLRKLVVDQLFANGEIQRAKDAQRRSGQRLIDQAMALKGENTEILDILIAMGKVQASNAELTPVQKMMEQAAELRTMVDNIFLGSELNFAVQFANLDLAEAKEEELSLIQEELDLRDEEVELTQELVDLQNSQIETAEELVEQQELINEALEIEQRIRDGFSLSANQQLRREKLRKDRRRVELAAAQGSLEFADLEVAAIDENIKAIEDKALTQADADKLRADALEITQKAEIRRQEEIQEVEERRIEIGERLVELPREQLEAQAEILSAQKNIIITNLDVIDSMELLGSATVKQAQRMAQALQLPANAIAAISSGAISSQGAVANFSAQYGVSPGGSYGTLGQQSSAFLNAKNLLNPVAGYNNGLPSAPSNTGGVTNNFNNNINQNGFTAGDEMMMKRAAEMLTAQQLKNQRMSGGQITRS